MIARPMRVALASALLVCLVASADAVPALQLHSDVGTYNTATESWDIFVDPFDLKVVGATTPNWVHYIDNITLLVSVPQVCWDPAAKVTITADTAHPGDTNPLAPSAFYGDGQVTLTADASSDIPLQFGNPGDLGLFDDRLVPEHGVYPTYYWPVALPPLDVGGAGETVFDYNADFNPLDPSASGSDVGDIQYYNVEYAPFSVSFMLHIDMVGLAHNAHEKWTFAPFSHDVDARAVPEPMTALLLLAGIAGVVLQRRRR